MRAWISAGNDPCRQAGCPLFRDFRAAAWPSVPPATPTPFEAALVDEMVSVLDAAADYFSSWHSDCDQAGCDICPKIKGVLAKIAAHRKAALPALPRRLVSATAIALFTIAQAARDGEKYAYARDRARGRFQAAARELRLIQHAVGDPLDESDLNALVDNLMTTFDNLTAEAAP